MISPKERMGNQMNKHLSAGADEFVSTVRKAVNGTFPKDKRPTFNSLLGHDGHSAKILSSDIEVMKTARCRLYDALAKIAAFGSERLHWYRLEVYDEYKAADITAPLIPVQSLLDRTRKILNASKLSWITYPCQRILVDKNGKSSIISSQRSIIWCRDRLTDAQKKDLMSSNSQVKNTLKKIDLQKMDRAISWLFHLPMKVWKISTKRGSATLRATDAAYEDAMRLRILECRSQMSFSANFIGGGDGRGVRNGVHTVVRNWHRGRPVPASINVLPETFDIWLLWAWAWGETNDSNWAAMRLDRAPALPKLRRNTKPGKNRRPRPGQRRTPVPVHITALDRLLMKPFSVTE